MPLRYAIHFAENGVTSTATAQTYGAAEAVALAFERQHAGDREAYCAIYGLDGSNAGLGQRIHHWWGGERYGPRDTRSAMEKLFRKAVRSGARVTLIDGTGTWHINAVTSFERKGAGAPSRPPHCCRRARWSRSGLTPERARR